MVLRVRGTVGRLAGNLEEKVLGADGMRVAREELVLQQAGARILREPRPDERVGRHGVGHSRGQGVAVEPRQTAAGRRIGRRFRQAGPCRLEALQRLDRGLAGGERRDVPAHVLEIAFQRVLLRFTHSPQPVGGSLMKRGRGAARSDPAADADGRQGQEHDHGLELRSNRRRRRHPPPLYQRPTDARVLGTRDGCCPRVSSLAAGLPAVSSTSV
jgi:hypothetical protein